jgi:hypothetical protein
MRISASEPVQLWLQGLPPGTKQRVRREVEVLIKAIAEKLKR